jgi:glycosyltransferase involved in cell wall biosynthesis
MISGTFYPEIDGAVIAVSNLIKSLKKEEVKIWLLSKKIPGTPTHDRWLGITVIRAGPNGPSLIDRLFRSLNLFFLGFSLALKENPDIIHSHGISASLTGFLLSRILRKPLVSTFHGFQRLWQKEVRWRSEKSFKISFPIEKFFINQNNKVIAQSETLKEVLINLYRIPTEKVAVIPHAIDTSHFSYSPVDNTKNCVVLFVGSLLKVHGVDLFIRAANLVLIRNPDVRFLIIGKGPHKDTLQKLIDHLNLKQVIMVGSISNPETLLKYYKEATIVVVPLRYKGYILKDIFYHW